MAFNWLIKQYNKPYVRDMLNLGSSWLPLVQFHIKQYKSTSDSVHLDHASIYLGYAIGYLNLIESRTEEYRYAKQLAKTLWRIHYQENVPNWQPLGDLMGILTQIDNMIVPLMKKDLAMDPLKKMYLTLEQLEKDNENSYMTHNRSNAYYTGVKRTILPLAVELLGIIRLYDPPFAPPNHL